MATNLEATHIIALSNAHFIYEIKKTNLFKNAIEIDLTSANAF